MKTQDRPILIGEAEEIKLLPLDVRRMLENEGLYIGSDPKKPLNGEAPLVSMSGKIYSMVIEKELDPECVIPGTHFDGPFRASEPDMKLEGNVPIRPPKRRMDWIGKRVRTLRDLRNGVMSIRKGTVCTVRHAHRGAELESRPCPCCGVTIHITRVAWDDLEFLGD